MRFCHRSEAFARARVRRTIGGTCPALRQRAGRFDASRRRRLRPYSIRRSNMRIFVMATHGRGAKAIGIALDSDRRVRIEDLRSGILLMLGAWIAYFVVVELFIRTLDRIIVPVLDVPDEHAPGGAGLRSALSGDPLPRDSARTWNGVIRAPRSGGRRGRARHGLPHVSALRLGSPGFRPAQL